MNGGAYRQICGTPWPEQRAQVLRKRLWDDTLQKHSGQTKEQHWQEAALDRDEWAKAQGAFVNRVLRNKKHPGNARPWTAYDDRRTTACRELAVANRRHLMNATESRLRNKRRREPQGMH